MLVAGCSRHQSSGWHCTVHAARVPPHGQLQSLCGQAEHSLNPRMTTKGIWAAFFARAACSILLELDLTFSTCSASSPQSGVMLQLVLSRPN